MMSKIKKIIHGIRLRILYYRAKRISDRYARAITAYRNGGFWMDVIWSSPSTVIIKPKKMSKEYWIGMFLETGEYLEGFETIFCPVNFNSIDNISDFFNGKETVQ